MKNPNGYGGISKLSGNRRKPWRVRITKGWILDADKNKIKQNYAVVGYYVTRKEAIEALANYNQNPYDIETESITFSEVYEKWSEGHFKTIVPSACRTWQSAYNHSAPLHNMRMRDIRANHLEGTIADANVGSSTKQRMKSLYNMLYKYCLKHDIVDKDYAALCDSVKHEGAQIVRIPYSDDEMQTLWSNLAFPFVDMVLIGIYSGWRPQELAILQIANVNIEAWTFTGGLKTDAGRNRTVPIHPRIRELVKKNYDKALAMKSAYLFNDENGQQGTHLTYDKYRGRFNKINLLFGMNHKPHDTRHTFITWAKAAGVDEYILKLIVGHEIDDVTEKVYTHRTAEQLQEEIIKINK